MAQVRALHVIEPFTLHEYEPVEGGRPRIKQTTFDKGELVTDEEDLELLDRALKEGTVGHNHFVQTTATVPDEKPAPAEPAPAEPAAE